MSNVRKAKQRMDRGTTGPSKAKPEQNIQPFLFQFTASAGICIGAGLLLGFMIGQSWFLGIFAAVAMVASFLWHARVLERKFPSSEGHSWENSMTMMFVFIATSMAVMVGRV